MNTFFEHNRKSSLVLSFFLAVCLVVVPAVSYAQVAGEGSAIINPLAENGINDIPSLITIIVTAVKNIGYFLIVFFIIYSGFLFVKARGDEKGITDAKRTFLWTVVGAAVLLGAEILANVIQGTVNELETRNTTPIIQQDIV